MSDYTELVQRLRDSQHNNIIAGWEGDARDDREAADAITKLGAERDVLKDELRRTCEHLGLDHLLAERDALRHDIERHVAIAAAQATEIDALAALLRECREDWIRLAYGASHEDVAAYRDFATRIDAALDKP